MPFSQIKETCLYVSDLDRTETFYSGKLNLEIVGRSEGRHIFFRVGSSILLCFIARATKQAEKLPSHYGEGDMHIAFEVPPEEYENTKSWIRSKGIEIEHEEQWSSEFRSFYFRDPDGHSLEVVPRGMWRNGQ